LSTSRGAPLTLAGAAVEATPARHCVAVATVYVAAAPYESSTYGVIPVAAAVPKVVAVAAPPRPRVQDLLP